MNSRPSNESHTLMPRQLPNLEEWKGINKGCGIHSEKETQLEKLAPAVALVFRLVEGRIAHQCD